MKNLGLSLLLATSFGTLGVVACSDSGDSDGNSLGGGGSTATGGSSSGHTGGSGEDSSLGGNAGSAGGPSQHSGSGGAGSGGAPPTANLLLSFIVMGCNRVDTPEVPLWKSTANESQLNRTFDEIAEMDPKPAYLFFTGDLVMGYTNETDLSTQLTAWKAVWENSAANDAGVQLVAIAGNHETQNKAAGKKSYLAAEMTWLSLMADYIPASNGPGANPLDAPEYDANKDTLATDQSQLTYSFDNAAASTHFVVMNTDPVGSDWSVPVKWIAADIVDAKSRGLSHVFTLGHKPAFSADAAGLDGLAFSGTTARDTFWASLTANHSEASFAAHNHLWQKTNHAGTWQVIAGNAGSPLESYAAEKYFGFTEVQVWDDGSVKVISHGRDVPEAGYATYASPVTYPTTIRETVDVTWINP